MTLFDVVKKNIIGNFKNYLVYLVSLLVSVVIYYTFVSLQYSTVITQSIKSSQSMQSIFLVASIVLIFFVAIFSVYSNSFFARKRKNEIGLYSLLGLPRKTAGKMLFYENLIIGGVVLVIGITAGTFLSKLFSMVLLRLLGTSTYVGITFSVQAIVNTTIVFSAIILFTSIQEYRLIYRFRLTELFRAEQEGEYLPKASVVRAVLALALLGLGYRFAFQSFSNNEEIFRNLVLMVVGITTGTLLLFSSLVVWLLQAAKRNKRSYYNGMNLISIANLVYRINGNAHSLAVISLLSALALSAANVGFGLYYRFEDIARLTAPFSYMFVAKDPAFEETVDRIIRADQEHPLLANQRIPVIKTKATSSSPKILPERYMRADDNPVKVVSLGTYNQAAQALQLPSLAPIAAAEAIAIRPLYTDLEPTDYENETITLQLGDKEVRLSFTGMTVERILNWSFPDVTIVVNDATFRTLAEQNTPLYYVGYAVGQQKTTAATANELAVIQPPQAELSTFYSVYRLGIEDAALNVFVLGFLALVFVTATGSVLYFKQLTEATTDKRRYDILRSIGVSNREISVSILTQNAFLFVLPLTAGVAHYLMILSMLKRLFSSIAGVNLTMSIIISIASFMLIYAVYYIITINSISNVVIGESAPVVRIAAFLVALMSIAAASVFVWSTAATPQEAAVVGNIIRLDLPKPTGRYVVGTTELHLIDDDRVDPWVNGTSRELMISIWYPARHPGGQHAPYMQPAAAAYYDQNIITTIGLDSGQIDLSGINTNAWLGAPVEPNATGWPVIVYSPGGSVPRSFGSVVVAELATRGYVVVTIDHTYETSVVAFPDGRIATEQLPEGSRAETILKMLDVRVRDVQFVLDQLAEIQAGENPDHQQHALPSGLAEAIDLSAIGIFGHSAGGATAAQAMYVDERIDAGINMDGTIGYMPEHPLPVVQGGLDRPFMLMEAGYTKEGEIDSHLTAPDRYTFWQNSSGWKLDLSVPMGMHYTFTDYQFLLPMLANRLSIAPAVTQNLIGSTDPEQMLAAQREYIGAFFDLHLKEIPQPWLRSSSPRYPEVEVVE